MKTTPAVTEQMLIDNLIDTNLILSRLIEQMPLGNLTARCFEQISENVTLINSIIIQ